MDEIDALLAEQARYYRERAGEYDDWWLRRGRYDGGPEENARWLAEIAEVDAALERFDPRGDVLELACGTGLWTRRLAPLAGSLTALDASPEVLAINRERVGDPRVVYLQADLFHWRPPRRYDVCFFGFWLSHVPESRFARFWGIVQGVVRHSGRVFLVDSGSGLTKATVAWDGERQRRRLADGREFDVVKRIYEPEELERILAGLGWRADLSRTASFFLYGSVVRS
ncbi:MAG: class I SAM-dependent methyltransferase [Gaiellaceae bacterium]